MDRKLIIWVLMVFLSGALFKGYCCIVPSFGQFDLSVNVRRLKVPSVQRYLDFVEQISAGWASAEVSRSPFYVHLHGGHLNHSRNLILQAAELSLAEQAGDSTTRVLVVGAGNCLDIPLKELTDMFDEVYLLDLAYKTTSAIIDTGVYYELKEDEGDWDVEKKHLTEEERNKLHFVLADAAGGAAFEIAKRVEKLVQKPSVTQEDILKIPQNITLSQLPFKNGYFDLITSSTVLSDLLTLAEDYMIHRLDERNASFYVNSPDMGEELVSLNERIGKHHITEAYRLLKDTGRFYLSASRFTGTIFHPVGHKGGKAGDFLAPGEFIHHLVREVSMPEDLTTLAAGYFNAKPSEQDKLDLWLWPIDNNMAIGVQVLILSKRENMLPQMESINTAKNISTPVLLDTVKNIYNYRSPLADRVGHYTFGLIDYLMNEGLYIINKRLRSLIRSEFKNKGIEFGNNFVPHLYATSPVLLNRNDLRSIFFGNDEGKVQGIVLDGDIVLTRLAHIANDTNLNDVRFKAAVYVGRGWHLENVYAERCIFSDGVISEGAAFTTDLSDIEVIHSYVGAGAGIKATRLKNTVIPEGRIFPKETVIKGLMDREISLAYYLSANIPGSLDLMGLLNGNNEVPGSDIHNLPYAGRVTSIAAAFCLLLKQNEEMLVENYLRFLPEDIENDVKKRMKVVSGFINTDLYKKLCADDKI